MLPRRRGFFDFVFSLSSSLFHSRDDPPVFERAQGHAREYQLHGRGGEPRHVAEEGEKGKEKKGERNDRRCTENGKIRAAKPCFQSRDSQKESFSFYPSTRLLNAAEYNDGPVRRPPRDGHGSRRGRYSCSAGGGRKGAGRERTREREREKEKDDAIGGATTFAFSLDTLSNLETHSLPSLCLGIFQNSRSTIALGRRTATKTATTPVLQRGRSSRRGRRKPNPGRERGGRGARRRRGGGGGPWRVPRSRWPCSPTRPPPSSRRGTTGAGR